MLENQLKILLPCVFLSISMSGEALAAPTIAKEYQIKAAFLYNLANFVRWPNEALPTTNDIFTVCIIGDDPFQSVLDITFDDVQAQGHALKALRIDKIPSQRLCHILFISGSEQGRVKEILKAVAEKPVLTVADMDHFICNGGMIQFFTRYSKIRLAISNDKLKKIGLRADANLLRLAGSMKDIGECE